MLPDWVPLDAWNGWLEMRKRKKWVLTERAERQAVKKLQEYREQGYDIEWILDEANNQNWRGLFVNDRTPRLQPKAQFTSPERAQEILDMIERQRAAARVH